MITGMRRAVQAGAIFAISLLMAGVVATPASSAASGAPMEKPNAALPPVAPGLTIAAVVVPPVTDPLERGRARPVVLRDVTWAEAQAAAAAIPGSRLQRLFPPRELVATEGADVIDTPAWNGVGYTGQGVKVAVVDSSFNGYQSLLGSELPASVTTRSFRGDGQIETGSVHGTGVAEIIHDIAPDAQMYLITVQYDLEMTALVEYLIAEGVDVVNMSLGWTVGPFDGSSFLAQEVQRAVDAGIIWVNAAGNEAETHWGGTFTDQQVIDPPYQPGTGWHEWASGDERLSFDVGPWSGFSIDMSWDDPGIDLDLALRDPAGNIVAWSAEDQLAGARPIESIAWSNPTGSTQTYSVSVLRYAGTGSPRLDLFVPAGAVSNLEHPVAASSINVPADVTDVVTVGATPFFDPTETTSYSSQGPTVDGRIKPDIVGPTSVSTVSYGTWGFGGTSSASPHVAALAALRKEADPSLSPAGFMTAIAATATPLPGQSGKDPVAGWGLVQAGSPPPAPDPGCDLDGDGFGDLVFAAPGEDLGTTVDAGMIHVVSGMAGTLDPASATHQARHQDTAGIEGTPEADDRFGAAWTCGDFDGDGFDDLAVGVPGDTVSGEAEAGAVQVMYGSAARLDDRDALITLDSPGIKGVATAGDHFGTALAAGDFDADGFDDLAVGIPDADGGAGRVSVIFGSATGLSETDQSRSQADTWISGSPEAGDRFGAALGAGDVTGDGHDDLVVGSPGEGISRAVEAGMVHVLYGSPSGLTSATSRHQGQTNMRGAAEGGDGFGAAVAIGDVDGDGYGDVVVGVPGEDVGAVADAGLVAVIYGSASGVTSLDDVLTQDADGIKGAAEAGDGFGADVAAGDVDRDGFADVVVGVPGEDLGVAADAGLVAVVFGGSGGLTVRDLTVHQGTTGVPGLSEPGDAFGTQVRLFDIDGDRALDIVIGAPWEDIGLTVDAGTVVVAYGDPSGSIDRFSPGIGQGSPGVAGSVEADDRAGSVADS